MKLSDLLRGKKGREIDYPALIEDQNKAKSEAAAKIESLTGKRADALLEADDAELDRIEAALTAAYREHDRADAALAELERRAAAAVTAATKADEERRLAEARKAAKDGAALIGLYTEQAAALAEMLAKIAQAERIVSKFNLDREGFQHIEPEWVATPQYVAQAAAGQPELGAGTVGPIYQRVRLPHATDSGAHWPTA